MYSLIATLLPLADEVPAPEDVKAGWIMFFVWGGLALGVVVIGYFLSRSLKKSNATFEAGGYDESGRNPRDKSVDLDN